jgi:hypothetical protein
VDVGSRRGRRRWVATTDANVTLTIGYIPASVNRHDFPEAPGWFLDIDTPETGICADIHLAKRLEDAKRLAVEHWRELLLAAVEGGSAERAVQARLAVAEETTVMTARLARDGNGNTPQRTIRVPDDEWLAAKAAAEANGETISDVIRVALQRYAARKSAKP